MVGVVQVSCSSFAFSQQFEFSPSSESAPPNVSESASSTTSAVDRATPPENSRILGIIPNNRTWPSLINYKPLTPEQKFEIARRDSFDRGTVVLAAAFGGYGQLSNANRSFGQGIEGSAHYIGTSYADFVIGNYLSEAVFPMFLHQDPRYFRRGVGSAWSRIAYSMGQIILTHSDTGRTQFNYSEILGNSAAVAISNDSASKLGIQLGVDMASNVLKEFWPDARKRFARKYRQPSATN